MAYRVEVAIYEELTTEEALAGKAGYMERVAEETFDTLEEARAAARKAATAAEDAL